MDKDTILMNFRATRAERARWAILKTARGQTISAIIRDYLNKASEREERKRDG